MARIHVTKFHLIALSIVGILPHSTGLWNFELKAGIGVQIIANLVAAVAFVVFYSSIAELTSTFPFAGGSYAFARCTVGFYPGYLIGCIEVLYQTLLLVWTNAAMIVFIRGDDPTIKKYEAYIGFALFISNFATCISKKWIYNLFVFLAIYGLSMNLIYIFGAIQYSDFSRWAYLPRHTDDDAVQVVIAADDNAYVDPSRGSSSFLFVIASQRIFEAFSTTLWTYKGLEYVNLMSEDVIAPRSMIPLAQMIGVATLVIFNTSIPVIGSSMYPGIERLIKLASPSSPGFSQIFNVTHRTATLIALPVLYGSSTVTCYSLTKLIAAMAESRLFPKFLGRRAWNTRTPIFALGAACCISLFVLLGMGLTAQKDFPHFTTIIGVYALLTYCMQSVSFIVLRLKLSTFPREFRSPFGIPGAIVCMVVFFAGIGCALSVSKRTIPAIVVGVVYIVAVSSYYFWFAKHSQTFSAEEKAVVLPAHVGIKNANGEHRRRRTSFDFVSNNDYLCPSEYLYNKFPCLGAIVSLFFEDRQRRTGRYHFCKRLEKVAPLDANRFCQNEDLHAPAVKILPHPAMQNGHLVVDHNLQFISRDLDNNNFQSGTGETSVGCNDLAIHNRCEVDYSGCAVNDGHYNADTSCMVNMSHLSTVCDLKSSDVVNVSLQVHTSGRPESEVNDDVLKASEWHIVELHPLPTSQGPKKGFQQQHEEFLQQHQRVRGFESSSIVSMDVLMNS